MIVALLFRWHHLTVKSPQKLCLLLILMVQYAIASDVSSVSYSVRTWGREEGLPHSIINSIVQGRQGYLWIGMYVGVARFDGTQFVTYSSANMPELGNGRVSKLFEDRDGTLLIGMESGRLIAWKDGVASILRDNSGNLNEAIVSFAQDGAGTIWLQTENGRLGRVKTNGVEFVHNSNPTTVLQRSSLGLVVDGNGELWVGTTDGLMKWDGDRLMSPAGLAEVQGQPIDILAKALDGSIWAAKGKHLYKIQGGRILSDVAMPPQLRSKVVDLLEAHDHRLWISSEDGHLYYLESSGAWKTFMPELLGANGILYEDREGNLWRGSFGGGLTQIRHRVFTCYEPLSPGLLRYVFSICSDVSGNVWEIFGISSLARIDAGKQTLQILPKFSIQQSIITIFSDSRNLLWLGTDCGAYLYHVKDGVLSAGMKVDPKAEEISALFEDTSSNIWVGFTKGAGVGFMPKGDVSQWRVLEGMPFPDVCSIAQGTDGAMWFGTRYGGVVRWRNGQWNQYTMRDGLPSDYVRCLQSDSDGTIWLGTLNGLCRWRNGSFKAITSRDGLWNDSISHIAIDRQGNLWMSSFGGIFRVPRKNLNDFLDGHCDLIKCVGYDRQDGLPNLECPGSFQPSGTQTPDGRLWFPTIGGLVSVDPNHLVENTNLPPVRIEEVTVDDKQIPIWHGGTLIDVPPGKRRFEFHFAALSLTEPEKNLFRFKLEGLDPDWSRPNKRHNAAYYYIPPGRYTFRITACNNDGAWNSTGDSVTIDVNPFFWQTLWFKCVVITLFALALVGSAWWAERWRLHQRMERLNQQHAIERERTRIAKDIHDDLGANLTQIVYLSQRVESNRLDPDQVKHWIRFIPDLAQRTIRSLDEIVWAVNPRHDTLEGLANYLSQFAQEHLTLAGVRCILDVPTVLPESKLTAEVRHNLLLAAREAVQNVVAHATATEVHISLQADREILEIAIIDNGIGFMPDKVSGKGDGLTNMHRRLESIGGRLEILSRIGNGTTVKLRYTLHKPR